MPLQLEGLKIQREGRQILDDVSLCLEAGQLLAVLGANGAGKSSLLSAITGEIEYAQGSIHFDAQDLAAMSVAQQARVRAVLPQQTELVFPFSVQDVVAMGAYPFNEACAQQVTEWIEHALLLLDALPLKNRPYEQLSGGEQKRVQLARVLVQCLAMRACEGRVYLFLDEPLANMDPKHQLELLSVLRQLAHEHRFAILLILHDVNLAAQCDQILLLANQTVIALGAPAAVLNPANLRQVFEVNMTILPHPLDANSLLILPDLIA
jgi:iron complex transport system ATP-binding protein